MLVRAEVLSVGDGCVVGSVHNYADVDDWSAFPGRGEECVVAFSGVDADFDGCVDEDLVGIV